MPKFKCLEVLFSSLFRKDWDAMNASQKGICGERLALSYCRKQLGFKLIAKNWRFGKNEIDLICLDGHALVFIEVRLRHEAALVSGVDSINTKKRVALRKCAKAYLKKLSVQPHTYRFDIISLAYGASKSFTIMYYPNVDLF